MKAKIYKPAKNAMQSGIANVQKWIIEFEQKNSRFTDPLMGWTGSTDMNQEIKLKFNSKEEAISYAQRNDIEYEVIEPKTHKPIIKSYADNFK